MSERDERLAILAALDAAVPRVGWTPLTERCLRPFIEFGDVSQCHLLRDHENDCATANAERRNVLRMPPQVVAALRAIVEMHDMDGDHCVMCHWEDPRGCPTLRAVAGIWSTPADSGEGAT